MSNFDVIETGGAPVKAWIRGVPLEDAALRQLCHVAQLPFIHSHVAVMPDVHWGMGRDRRQRDPDHRRDHAGGGRRRHRLRHVRRCAPTSAQSICPTAWPGCGAAIEAAVPRRPQRQWRSQRRAASGASRRRWYAGWLETPL